MSTELKPLFEPKSVVLVGDSDLEGEDKVYSTLFHFLVQNLSSLKKGKVCVVDFSGKILESYKNLSKVPTRQDLAIVLLPKKPLAKNLQKILNRRVKSLVLIEGKLDGAQIAELENTAKRRKMAFLGPDSIGIINTTNSLFAVPERAQISKGQVAVVTQDCCAAHNVLDLARTTGISKLISTNQTVGTNVTEILSYLSQDKETKVICAHIKGVREGREFVRVLREIVAEKPVIILNGSNDRPEVFKAVVKQAGALLAHDAQDMLNGAGGLARQPPLPGERIAIVTNLAGQAALFERYLAEEELSLAKPSVELIGKIKKKYPSAEISDFINLGSGARADAYKHVVEMLLAEENVDGVIMINSVKSTLFDIEDLRKVAEVAKRSREKPVIDAVLCAEGNATTKEIMSNTDLPIYNQLEEAAHVLRILRARGKQLEKLQKPKTVSDHLAKN